MTPGMEKLQGAWSIVSLEAQGMPVSSEAFRGSQIVMEGDREADTRWKRLSAILDLCQQRTRNIAERDHPGVVRRPLQIL